MFFRFFLRLLFAFCLCANLSSAAREGVFVDVIQQVARGDATRSITFLSSGYTSANVSRFDDDVHVVVDALRGHDSNGLDADPWPRYVSLFNIYAVFEASRDVGAKRLEGPQHKWGLVQNREVKPVENNLGCAFGTPEASELSCNRGSVYYLAKNAPSVDLVVVLVNEPSEVAGASGAGIAVTTNAPKFLSFLAVRGLSLIAGSLASEYKRGSIEPANIPMPNCAMSLDEANERWGRWGNVTNSNFEPTLGCHFNNYYRASAEGCMMRSSSVNSLCVVCREALNVALIEKSRPNFLAAARCPREGHRVHVNRRVALVLTVGIVGTQSNVQVTWAGPSGEALGVGSTAKLEVQPSVLSTWTFPATVTATIEDSSPYVMREKRSKGFRAFTVFSLVDIEVTPACTVVQCDAISACVSCEKSGSFLLDDLVPNANVSSVKMLHAVSEKDVALRRISKASKYGFLSFIICSGVVVVAITIITLTFYCCYKKSPHEILSPTFPDSARIFMLAILCVAIIVLSASAVVIIVYYAESDKLIGGFTLLVGVIVGVVSSVFAFIEYGSVLFRHAKLILVGGIALFIIGLPVLGVGAFFYLTYMFSKRDSFIVVVANLWLNAVKRDPGAVCGVQWDLRCSGFYSSCLEVNGSYCPEDCPTNVFANSCWAPYMERLAQQYMYAAIFCILWGLLLVLAAVLGIFLFFRLRQLSATGKWRRQYRLDPQPPVLPFTFREINTVGRLFNCTVKKPGDALDGKRARHFLECVFDIPLHVDYQMALSEVGPWTVDELMTVHFPFFRMSRVDPRQLFPDEVEHSAGAADVQRKQYEKCEMFAEAAGCLSPENVFTLYRSYSESRFMPDESEFLDILRREAAATTPETELCRGISAVELDGLRNAWVAINPRIVGDLNEEEIDYFYQWTRGKPLFGLQQFQMWKRSLDVRNRGAVGWGEFCFPFAQRALLREARVRLSSDGLDVPPEMVPREVVLSRFGKQITGEVFLSLEKEVPIERLLAHILQKQ